MKKFLASLTDKEAAELIYEWEAFWARPEQLAPGTPFSVNDRKDWLVWLILAGRGFGKTRSGAEEVRRRVESGRYKYIGLIAPTAGDAREVMVEGESGLMNVFPPHNRPIYEPSKRRLTWPNGCKATTYSADEPERLRGPQHDFIWADEIAAWRYAEAWDMALFTLRLGHNPQAVITTTPKPLKIVRDLVKDPSTVITKGRTSDNENNLAKTFVNRVVAKFKGTRLGRQELDAELLEDIPGALWTFAMLDATRVQHGKQPEMQRIVVSVDPSGSNGPQVGMSNDGKSNDIGITVCGLGVDGHGYLLEDLTINASPGVWGRRAVDAYHRWDADRVVAEDNFGGAMVQHVIRSVDAKVPYKSVRASRGKVVRAEPVSSLYEPGQEKIHHVGTFPDLETQMTQMTSKGYVGEGSPDRVDAAVWGFTELLITPKIVGRARVGRVRYHSSR